MHKDLVCVFKILALSLSFLLGIYLTLYFLVVNLAPGVQP